MPINLNELLNSAIGQAQLLHDMKTRANNALNSSPVSFNPFDNPSAQIQRTTDNIISLRTGEHPGLNITTSTTVSGISGTKILASIALPDGRRTDSARILTDNVVVTFFNIHFLGRVQVGLQATAAANMTTAIFNNCIFDGQVHSHGKVHYLGCEFRSTVNSTLTSSGAANNFVIGCSRKGGPHAGAITIIAETT